MMIAQEITDGCLVLRLNRTVINAINGDLVEELSSALESAVDSREAKALVLTSTSEKFFSIGLDIPALFPLNREEFSIFLRNFNRLTIRLLTLPKPIVSAIGGHAVAGGCILALGCDYRIIANGKKFIGLNEAKLGVPVPYPALRRLIDIVGPRAARDVVDSAEFYAPEAALRIGLVDQVVTGVELEQAALTQAKRLAEIPSAVYARIKQDRVVPMVEDIMARLEETERAFLDHWFSPTTRETLRQAAEKFRN